MVWTKGFETRVLLIDAGLAIAAEEGFDAITPERVGAAAERSRPGVMVAFGSVPRMRKEIVAVAVDAWKFLFRLSDEDLTLTGLWMPWSLWIARASRMPLLLDLLPGFGEQDRAHPDRDLRDEVIQLLTWLERQLETAISHSRERGLLTRDRDAAELHRGILAIADHTRIRSRLVGRAEALDAAARDLFGLLYLHSTEAADFDADYDSFKKICGGRFGRMPIPGLSSHVERVLRRTGTPFRAAGDNWFG